MRNRAASTPGEAFDLQKKYLELIPGLMGLTNILSVEVEPTLAEGPDAAKQAKTKAIEKAKQLARNF